MYRALGTGIRIGLIDASACALRQATATCELHGCYALADLVDIREDRPRFTPERSAKPSNSGTALHLATCLASLAPIRCISLPPIAVRHMSYR